MPCLMVMVYDKLDQNWTKATYISQQKPWNVDRKMERQNNLLNKVYVCVEGGGEYNYKVA